MVEIAQHLYRGLVTPVSGYLTPSDLQEQQAWTWCNTYMQAEILIKWMNLIQIFLRFLSFCAFKFCSLYVWAPCACNTDKSHKGAALWVLRIEPEPPSILITFQMYSIVVSAIHFVFRTFAYCWTETRDPLNNSLSSFQPLEATPFSVSVNCITLLKRLKVFLSSMSKALGSTPKTWGESYFPPKYQAFCFYFDHRPASKSWHRDILLVLNTGLRLA